MSERWRSIPGFTGLYEVSDAGRVRRVAGRGCRVARVLRPQRRNRYLKVDLYGRSRRYQPSVHTLVALAFIGPRPTGKTVNHRDGDRTNNAAYNLEYLTPGDNMRHAYRLGLKTRLLGEANGRSKLTEAQVIEARERVLTDSGASVRQMAEAYGVSTATLWNAVKKKTWRHIADEHE